MSLQCGGSHSGSSNASRIGDGAVGVDVALDVEPWARTLNSDEAKFLSCRHHLPASTNSLSDNESVIERCSSAGSATESGAVHCLRLAGEAEDSSSELEDNSSQSYATWERLENPWPESGGANEIPLNTSKNDKGNNSYPY